MQGSDLEKVERKFAEIEFSKREKEKTIFQNYSHIQSKLENGSESAFDLIPMAGQLVEIQKELKQQKQLEARLAKLHGRLDNYYRLRGPSDAMANSNMTDCQQEGFHQALDQDMKVLIVPKDCRQLTGGPEGEPNHGAFRVDVISRYLPSLFKGKRETEIPKV